MASINFVSVFFIIILSIGLANALVDPKPVLYGQAFDGAVAADGSIVTIYPQNNVSDKLSDTVGAAGNVGVSSYWKLELNDLDTNVQNGDIIVINLSDGVSYTTRSYTVDLDGDGAVYILLNLDPAFQDYDDDGFFADTDCDDNDAQINPDADEIEDGVDNDCDGLIDEGTNAFDDDEDGLSEDQGDCNDSNNTIYPGAPEICGDGIDQDCSGADLECEFEVDITLEDGWVAFGLPFKPLGIDDTEELGQTIINSGIPCDVILRFNGETQEMESDILGLPDPSFALSSGTEAYFIHCDADGIFTYGGEPWE